MCVWVSIFSTTGKFKRETCESAKTSVLQKMTSLITSYGPSSKNCPGPPTLQSGSDDTFKVLQFAFHPNHCIHCNIWQLNIQNFTFISIGHNVPVKQWTDSQPHSIFKTKKSIIKSCTSSPWHISDRLECWPMPSQCLICKPLCFKQFG